MLGLRFVSGSQSLSQSDESKATLKHAESRTLGTVQRVLEEVNAAIAEKTYKQVGFANLQISLVRRV